MKKITGLVFLVGGAGLSWWGYSISQSISSKFTKIFSGAHSDKAIILVISGIICVAIGLSILYKEVKK